MTGSLDGGTTGGQVVRFTSLNTGGLNAALKRTKVMTYIKNLNADVILLQETHLLKTDHRKLNRPWIGQLFHSQFNCKTRGTAILIRKKCSIYLQYYYHRSRRTLYNYLRYVIPKACNLGINLRP